MKKVLAIILAVAMVFALAACGTSAQTPATTTTQTPATQTTATAAPEQVEVKTEPAEVSDENLTELVYANFNSSASVETKMLSEKFIPQANEWLRPYGYKIGMYNDAQLGSMGSSYDDLIGGLYDFAMVPPILFNDSDFFPYNVICLPFACTDPHNSDIILADLMNEFSFSGGEGVKAIGFGTTSTYYLSYGKDTKVSTLKDMNGLTMRSQSNYDIAYFKLLGINPVTSALNEAYDLLAKKTVDGFMMNAAGFIGFSFYEVCSSWLDYPYMLMPQIFCVSDVTLSSMPDEVVDIIVNQVGPLWQQVWQESIISASEMGFGAMKDNGMYTVEFTEEEYAEMRQTAKIVWQQFIDDANSKGYDGEALVQRLSELMDEYGYEPAPITLE